MSVLMNGVPVKGNLSAAEIIIWNAGKLPIRHEDIRKPIILVCGSNCPIYQIITKTSRDVVSFSLDGSHSTNGVLGIDWNILEQNDGAKIQIIYGGETAIPIYMGGVVVGQKRIGVLSTDQIQKGITGNIQSLLAMIFASCITGMMAKHCIWNAKSYRRAFGSNKDIIERLSKSGRQLSAVELEEIAERSRKFDRRSGTFVVVAWICGIVSFVGLVLVLINMFVILNQPSLPRF